MIKTYNKTILKTFPALLFVIVISTVKLFGQTDAKEFAEVDDLFLNDRFAVALPYYRNFLKNDSSNTNLNFKIGVCYLNSRSQKVKAIGYLEKAVGVASPIVAYKFLGDAYHLAKKFDLAIASYDKFKKVFLADKPKDISILEEVNWKIEMCRFGKKLQELDTIRGNLNTNSYKDKNAIKNINFFYTDYTSAMSLDQSTMTFTFQRPDGIKKKLPEDGKYFEDIYIPVKTNLIPAPKTVIDTTTNRNEASVATSVDGQIVLTYKDDKGDGNLYITRLTGNQWSSPEKLNKPVNKKDGNQTNSFQQMVIPYTLQATVPEVLAGKIFTYAKNCLTENGEKQRTWALLLIPPLMKKRLLYIPMGLLYFSAQIKTSKVAALIFSAAHCQWTVPGQNQLRSGTR